MGAPLIASQEAALRNLLRRDGGRPSCEYERCEWSDFIALERQGLVEIVSVSKRGRSAQLTRKGEALAQELLGEAA